MHFLGYLAGVATFCPLNSRRIKRSRASERSDQGRFSPIKILDPGHKRFYRRRVCDHPLLARKCLAGVPRSLNSANFLFQIFNAIGQVLLQFSNFYVLPYIRFLS